ncbi:MAG: rhodanese-like domain-containing protein [Thermomicrobiales bacterium]
MLLRLLYEEKLAQASYFVGCQATGEALVIDPGRSIDDYLHLAHAEGMAITAVTETHIHADYVSGSRELAAVTGAKLYLSDEGDDSWKYQFAEEAGAQPVYDGDEFWVGNIKLQVMHTPGHTPEHISFILTDTAGANEPMGIFTGDFVFVGDVGRPDLLETAAGFKGTMRAGAQTLYRSLQRFKDLPDYLQVWPGHGAGSACGKALGAVPQSTVGYEKLFNWALTAETEDDFVSTVLDGQPEPPFYFKEMKRVNKEGPALVADRAMPRPLAPESINDYIAGDTPVVDMRSQLAFAGGHIPGTLNIPFSKSYLTWAGWLLPYDKPFALIVDERDLESTVRDLRRIGLDDVAGFWTPDIVDEWVDAADHHELQSVSQVTIEDVEAAVAAGSANVLDVRGTSEFLESHIPGAISVPMGYIPRELDSIPSDKPLIVHCQTGVRSSMIASSLLQKLGRTNIVNYMGSFSDWNESESRSSAALHSVKR